MSIFANIFEGVYDVAAYVLCKLTQLYYDMLIGFFTPIIEALPPFPGWGPLPQFFAAIEVWFPLELAFGFFVAWLTLLIIVGVARFVIAMIPTVG